MRQATQEILAVTDIALPSFDDEAQAWGDVDPQATLARLEQAGVAEIVVKDGMRDVAFSTGGRRGRVPTPAVANVRDTTGAGDAFNAGYLAARLVGMEPPAACGIGQRLAGVVIGHFGALAPTDALQPLREALQVQPPGPRHGC
jgi:2-dehydro-3-deoxygluconokinase